MKNIFLISMLSIVLAGCCLPICGPGLAELQIQLFDPLTGEDMLFSGKLDSDSIEVIYSNGTESEFGISSNPDEKLSWISIYEIEQGLYDYTIILDSGTKIMITSEVKEADTKCCPILSTNLIEVVDYSFEQTGFGIRYKIWID